MRKLFVIFNPTARSEKSRWTHVFLESKAGPDVTLALTTRPGEATRLAAEGCRAGYDVIVAAGGDGTINEVVNGMKGGVLGVLPLGTANVFARGLGIPLRLPAAWRLVKEGPVRTIDIGVAGSRKFVQLAGVGFDAAAVRAVRWKAKKQWGPLAYVMAALRTMRGPLPPVEVVVKGEVRAQGAMVLVGNGRFYGGPFRLFPQARMEDGLLDVCVFDRVGWVEVLRHGWGMLWGTHIRQRGVSYFQAAEFECRTVAPLQLDGEDVGDAPVQFRVDLKGLRVVAPLRSG